MPSPAKPMACSTAFCNAQTERQPKQKLKSHLRQPSNDTRVIFSKSFTKITTFCEYLPHRCNAEHKLTTAKPTTDGADWFVWLAQPISDGAEAHVTTSSLYLADVSAGQCREEFLEPGSFCFVSRAIRKPRWTALLVYIRYSSSTLSKQLRMKTKKTMIRVSSLTSFPSEKRGKLLWPMNQWSWADRATAALGWASRLTERGLAFLIMTSFIVGGIIIGVFSVFKEIGQLLRASIGGSQGC